MESEAGDHCAEGFGFANYDLNPDNVLADGEFNILAVIDWDTGTPLLPVPDTALYRVLSLMGVACACLVL